MELCSLLSRAAIENGAASSHIFSINNQFMEHVDTYRSTTELCYAMIEILTSFMDCMFPPTMENSRIVREAMNYISTHFAENITLQDVAEHLHLNQSYFSRIFQTLQRLYLQGVPDHGAGGGGQTAAEQHG